MKPPQILYIKFEEGGNLKKKINRQVTIVERAQEDGSCQALDFDYGY